MPSSLCTVWPATSGTVMFDRVVALLARARAAQRMVSTMRTAVGTVVERLDSGISDSGITGGLAPCLGRLLIAVIVVAELRGTVSRADRQVHAPAAPVPVRERAVEVS